MPSKRKLASYAVVIAAGAYALVYVVFLQDMAYTRYFFGYATVLCLGAMPILLFSLGVFLMHRLRPEAVAARTTEQRTRARHAFAAVIAALYVLYGALSLVASQPGMSLEAPMLMEVLVLVFYVIEYGGIVLGLLYGTYA